MTDDLERLRRLLRAIDGRGYKAYQDIRGACRLPRLILSVDHVQGDPFASPSRLRARVDQSLARFPAALYDTPIRRVALEDYLSRQFALAISRFVKGSRGTGHSGMVRIDHGGQEILARTSCVVTNAYVEARFDVGLPAAGRTCLGREAETLLLTEIPHVVEASLFYSALDASSVQRHVDTADDQEALRSQLVERGLVAFVGNGSVLPRRSGVSDEPLTGPTLVPFASPPELQVELATPHRGPVVGMGIPEGVTLIVGGGFHGKSTLLRALELGIYNHVPGDGRELVVTRGHAAKIRAEDGRRVEKVDISPFINNLPFGKDTAAFSTDNASGSTSQAANIVEALEMGTEVLLLDEDTSATNFMIRDELMQELVPKEKEPITPFVQQVRNLFEEHAVSTVLVTGGSGEYFAVADTVILMDVYTPHVVTRHAKDLVRRHDKVVAQEAPASFGPLRPRLPLRTGFDPYRGQRIRVDARGLRLIQFGRENIDLQNVEQLVDRSQTQAIANILLYAIERGYWDGRVTLREGLERVFADIDRQGLGVISPFGETSPGDYALPRPLETAAAVNRLRTLIVRQAQNVMRK